MKEYMCPYCDQRMKKKHRCDNCHSFVWKPVEIESHPEVFIDPQDDPISQAISDEKYNYGSPSGKLSEYTVDIPPQDGSGAKKKKKKERKERPAGTLLSRIVLIVIIIIVLLSVIAEFGVFVRNDTDEDLSEERTEFSAEEVIEAGEECTGGHMDINARDFIDHLESTLGGTYIDTGYYSEDSDNYEYIYHYQDVEERISHFNTDRMYGLMDEQYGYYIIEWDTVTERLHHIAFSVDHRADALAMTANAWTFLYPEETDAAGLNKELERVFAAAEQDGYYSDYESKYDFYVSYSEYEDGTGSWYVSFDGKE